MKIERVLANNPGPFTGPGTNTWILDDGAGTVCVIDPGPIDVHHQKAVLKLIGDRTPVAVVVTHTHSDHAPLANPLARHLDVPAVGHRPGPEFEPAVTLDEGDVLSVGGLAVNVLHTPGHADDHLCFRVGNVLFSGDHIIGGSSVMVERLGPYLDSLRRLQGKGLNRLLPGHGEEMADPDAVIDWYLEHRLQRHEQIYQVVLDGADNVGDVIATVYADVDPAVHPLAERSVRAHLVLLAEEGRLALEGDRLVASPS